MTRYSQPRTNQTVVFASLFFVGTVMFVAAGFGLLLAFGAHATKQQAREPDPAPGTRLTINQLHDEWTANPLAAHQKRITQTIEFTGCLSRFVPHGIEIRAEGVDLDHPDFVRRYATVVVPDLAMEDLTRCAIGEKVVVYGRFDPDVSGGMHPWVIADEVKPAE